MYSSTTNRCIQLGLLLLLILVVFLYFGDHTPNKYDEQILVSARQKKNGNLNLDSNHDRSGKVKNNQLPQFVIDRIKTFVFFLGQGHTGHSILASLMDAHPHMAISHEMNVFTRLSSGKLSPTKQDVFNTVWKNAVHAIDEGNSRNNPAKGYVLLVNGLYQGKYVDHIDVIGDKKAGLTANMLLTQPEEWSRVYNILKSFNVTVRVIQVLRNPFDIIATTILLESNSKPMFAKIKKSNKTTKVTPDQSNPWIERYFSYHNAIGIAKKEYNLDLIEIHSKDLILDPRGTLLKLCNHLEINCSNNYLEICSNKIFKTESRTRRLIKWTDEQIKMIQQNIDKYSNLKGYSLDSL